jgi:hypothetical protein
MDRPQIQEIGKQEHPECRKVIILPGEQIRVILVFEPNQLLQRPVPDVCRQQGCTWMCALVIEERLDTL